MVVLHPPAELLTRLGAALHNHGISCTSRAGSIRLSTHAALTDDTVDLLRAAFTDSRGF